jgi:hypothetical protein
LSRTLLAHSSRHCAGRRRLAGGKSGEVHSRQHSLMTRLEVGIDAPIREINDSQRFPLLDSLLEQRAD